MSSTTVSSVTDQLANLAKLRTDGVLTEAEFEKLKAKLISDSTDDPAAPNAAPEIRPGPMKPGAVDDSDEGNGALRLIGRFFERLDLVTTVGAVLIIIGGFLYPMINEGTSGPCTAVESIALREAAKINSDDSETSQAVKIGIAGFFQRASNGVFAARIAKSKLPNFPAPVGCTALYYMMLNDPGALNSQ